MPQIQIRKAVKEDCQRMMELIQELAVYEKAPKAVTVDFNHFVESGFGEKPVWWAFVASTISSEGGAITKTEAEIEALNSSATISGISSPTGGDRGGREVFGFALWYVRYSTWKGQRLYLEDLLVTEKMRGQGIGKLLFDKLIEECKEKNYNGMMWQVLDWNEPAINFYKKYPEVQFDEEWVNCSLNFSI